jgi:hypothetical protein
MISAPYTFLTTKPPRRFMSTSHPELLMVMAHVAITTPALKAVIAFTDGSTESFDLIASGDLVLRAGESKLFNVGYDQYDFDLFNAAKTIKSITIRIESADFADQSAQDYIQYYPKSFDSDTVKALYYVNSMAGYDTLICTGDNTESIETSGIVTAQPIESVYETAAAQYKNEDAQFRQSIRTSTGIKSRGEIEALKDFFNIKKAVEYIATTGGVKRIPIIPIGEGVSLPSSNSNIKQIEISYRYAFEDKVIDRIL